MGGGFFPIELVRGFWAPFRGIAFIRANRPLWKLVWIPILINIALFAALGALFVVFFPDLVGLILPESESWYVVIFRWVLWVVGFLLYLLLFLVTFTAVGTAISSPFNELLSERVERMVRGDLPESTGGLWMQTKRTMRSLIESLKHLGVYVLGSGAIALVALIPVVGGVISTVLGTFWTLLFLAMEFGDYYLSRHWIRFVVRWKLLWAHRWSSLGFGAGCALMLMIPVVNLLLMPGAVVGGTLLWLELEPPPAKTS